MDRRSFPEGQPDLGARPARPDGPNRWIVYQRERFPLGRTALVVAALSTAGVACSRLLRGESGLPSLHSLATAFVLSFGFFALMRIADEHKDRDDDARYRPYLPVPRGVVSLAGLRRAGVVVVVIQAAFAVSLSPRLLPFVAAVWAYLALMTVEFFAPRWLRDRPVIGYLGSHMPIMPLIDLSATGCDWVVAGADPPPGLGWFLMVSYGCGTVLEVGRKMRAPQDEEAGVATYTALYGRRRAAALWAAALGVSLVSALFAAAALRALPAIAAVLALTGAGATAVLVRFLRNPVRGAGRAVEQVSGIWVLTAYVTLMAVPLGARWLP